MAFLNNPLIASLAGSVGLGHLVPGADPAVNPSPTPKGSAPNQPEYKQARFFDPRSPQGARGGNPTTGMPTEPGALSPDVQNNPTVMDLLNHFGVHPTQQIDPGLFIHNANAWKNHPVMSGVLDGLLGGLANTKGGDTIGENLSNVAQGLAATHAQQTAHVNAQLMAPYQQAMTVASLQDQVGKQQLEAAQQKHATAMSDYYEQLPGMKEMLSNQQGAHQAEVQTIRNQGALQRQQESSRAKQAAIDAKPPNMDNDTYQKNLQGEQAKIQAAHSDDPNYELSPTDHMQAALRARTAVENVKTQGKINTAVTTSHATLGDKQALKATTPGSATTAPGGMTPERKAAIAAKEQDIRAHDGSKFIMGDTSKGEPPIITKNMPQYAARRQKLVSERDALINGNSSAAPSTSPKITHRFNVSTGKIEPVSN